MQTFNEYANIRGLAEAIYESGIDAEAFCNKILTLAKRDQLTEGNLQNLVEIGLGQGWNAVKSAAMMPFQGAGAALKDGANLAGAALNKVGQMGSQAAGAIGDKFKDNQKVNAIQQIKKLIQMLCDQLKILGYPENQINAVMASGMKMIDPMRLQKLGIAPRSMQGQNTQNVQAPLQQQGQQPQVQRAFTPSVLPSEQ